MFEGVRQGALGIYTSVINALGLLDRTTEPELHQVQATLSNQTQEKRELVRDVGYGLKHLGSHSIPKQYNDEGLRDFLARH